MRAAGEEVRCHARILTHGTMPLDVERAKPIPGSRWHALADRVLAGEAVSREDALAVIEAPDAELLGFGAAYRLRRH